MHHKLTEHGTYSMEKQWTPDQSHVKSEDNFNLCCTPSSYTAGLAMAFTFILGFIQCSSSTTLKLFPFFTIVLDIVLGTGNCIGGDLPSCQCIVSWWQCCSYSLGTRIYSSHQGTQAWFKCHLTLELTLKSLQKLMSSLGILPHFWHFILS